MPRRDGEHGGLVRPLCQIGAVIREVNVGTKPGQIADDHGLSWLIRIGREPEHGSGPAAVAGDDLFERPTGHLPAVHDDQHVGGDALQFVDLMGRENDGLAGGGPLAY